MKDFIWFTKTSWSYMKGERLQFFIGFISAWNRFRKYKDE